ncbi:MAG: class I SAM-dependent methyltransferase [Burkholderiales bacterium]
MLASLVHGPPVRIDPRQARVVYLLMESVTRAGLLVVAVMLLVGAAPSREVHAEGNHACGPGAAPANTAEIHEAEVLYLPTPHHVVEAMLRLAAVSQSDVVYDLGAGDGRIPIAAARAYGARGVGIELDGRMLERARCNARAAGMERLVEFRQADLFRADLREATVVTLFLFPEMNRRLKSKLLSELRPGTRIVSHRFGLGDWPPDRTIEASGHLLLLWTVPHASEALD